MTDEQVRGLRPGVTIWIGYYSHGMPPAAFEARFKQRFPLDGMVGGRATPQYETFDGGLYTARHIHPNPGEARAYVVLEILRKADALKKLAQDFLEQRSPPDGLVDAGPGGRRLVLDPVPGRGPGGDVPGSDRAGEVAPVRDRDDVSGRSVLRDHPQPRTHS